MTETYQQTEDDNYTMGDLYRAKKKHSQAKKQSNKENSLQVLDTAGVEHTVQGNNTHVIIKHKGTTVDFYPTTGLWLVRVPSKRGRGVLKLLAYLGIKLKPSSPA